MVLVCNVCGHGVRPHRHAASCDICSVWQHINCGTGIGQEVYRAAMRGERGPVSFVCQNCSPHHLQNIEEHNQQHLVTSTPPNSPSSPRKESERRTFVMVPKTAPSGTTTPPRNPTTPPRNPTTPPRNPTTPPRNPTTPPRSPTTPPRSPTLPKKGAVTTTDKLDSLSPTLMVLITSPENQQPMTSTPVCSPREPDITSVGILNSVGVANTVVELDHTPPSSVIVTTSEPQALSAVYIPELQIEDISLGEVEANSCQTENSEKPPNCYFPTDSDEVSTCRQNKDNDTTIQKGPHIRWPSSVYSNESDVPGIRRNRYTKFKRIELPQFDRSFFSDMSPESSFEESRIEDVTLTYTVIQKESGKDLLIDSYGYTYSVKRMTYSAIKWKCRVRTKHWHCGAMVTQRRNTFFIGSKLHNHFPYLSRAKYETLCVKINDELPIFWKCHQTAGPKVEKTSGNLNDKEVASLFRRSERIRTKKRKTVSIDHLHFKHRLTNDLSTVYEHRQTKHRPINDLSTVYEQLQSSIQIYNKVQPARSLVEDTCNQNDRPIMPLVVGRSDRIRAKYRTTTPSDNVKQPQINHLSAQLHPPRQTPMETDQEWLGGNEEDRPF